MPIVQLNWLPKRFRGLSTFDLQEWIDLEKKKNVHRAWNMDNKMHSKISHKT